MISREIKFFVLTFPVQFLITLQDSLYLQQEHLTIKRLGDIIISAELISLYYIFLHRFSAEEEQGNIRINISYFFCQRKPIHIGHHYIQQAEIKFFPLKSSQPKPAIS